MVLPPITAHPGFALPADGRRIEGPKIAQAFCGKFEPLAFTALRPKDPADSYDLAQIAAEAGQVLEVAVRNLSQYGDFDAQDYESRLGAFLDALSQQPGFVAGTLHHGYMHRTLALKARLPPG